MFGKKRPIEQQKPSTILMDPLKDDDDDSMTIEDYKRRISQNVISKEEKEELTNEDMEDYVDNEDDEYDEDEEKELEEEEEEEAERIKEEEEKKIEEKKDIEEKKEKQNIEKPKQEIIKEVEKEKAVNNSLNENILNEIKDSFSEIESELVYLRKLFLSNQDRIKQIEASLFRVKSNL